MKNRRVARAQGVRRQVREAELKREAGVRPCGKTRGCLGQGWSLGWTCGCRKVLGILPGAKIPAAKSAFPVILGQGCWWVSTAGDASWRRDSTYRQQTESLKQKTPWEPEWTRRN